jgi:hypothetical protein
MAISGNGGLFVEEIVFAFDGQSLNNFYGFTGRLFDRIFIVPGTAMPEVFTIDNLQFNFAGEDPDPDPIVTPEPATLSLVALGTLGLASLRRRLRRL